jgi:hypothetical protein
VPGFGDHCAANVGRDVGELAVHLVPQVTLGADGQDRGADRIGVMRPVLLSVDQARRYISRMALVPPGCSTERTISSMSPSVRALGFHICLLQK